MKIYTKNGDKGLTSLYNSAKISKSSVLIDLIGDLDELNCYIGNITSSRLLEDLQIWIFDLCTIIANPTHKYTFDKNEVVIKLLEKSDYLFTLARFENLDKREVIYRKSNIIANVVDNDE